MTQVIERINCRLCGSEDLWTAIPLKPLPIASPNVGARAWLKDVAGADVRQCRKCGFLQLMTVVDPELQYRAFRYTTGISIGLRDHFAGLISALVQRGEIETASFVLDIGSNDGSLLRYAKDRGARVLGVDPAGKIAEAATASGIPTIADFFTENLGQSIAVEHGRADIVISANTVANIDNLEDFFAAVREVISPRGLLVIETQYAMDVLQKVLLDVVYLEHLSYFAVRPLPSFLAANAFELVDAEKIVPKGGSIRLYIQPAGAGRTISPRVAALSAEEEAYGLYRTDAFTSFNQAIVEIGQELRSRLAASRARTGRALAYGASVGCAALIHYFQLGDLIDALFDDNPVVNYVRCQQHMIPVISGVQLRNEAATDIPVLAWRYAHNIARNQTEFRAAGGRFYTALPQTAYVDP